MDLNNNHILLHSLRGINLGNILDAPKEGDWGLFLQEEFFDLVQKAGFNLVRIPIRWSSHADINSPYRIDSSFFERIDWVVQNALSRGLTAILDIHHYKELMLFPEAHKTRFLSLWEQISTHYQNAPTNIFFELLNEPFEEFDRNPYLWNQYLKEVIPVIRRTNPNRKIIYGPVFYNKLRYLNMLEVPENDNNIVINFHFYEPFEFTHQGASWELDSNQWLGNTWEGTTQQKLAISLAFDQAVEWARNNNNIPLFLGEFGAIIHADYNSRVRWTTYIREEAEKRSIGWAYWNFCEDLFGIINLKTKLWDRNILKALLPNSPLI